MADWIQSELSRSLKQATKAGEARLQSEARAASARYDAVESLDERTKCESISSQ